MLAKIARNFAIDIKKVRNIGISAHIDSGKTTFTERILFYTGRIAAVHEVKGSDSVGAKMDSMELERERGITIKSAATCCKWKDHIFNIIDTPGHVDFTIEVERALRVLDGAILLICAASGVQSQTLTVDRQMRRYNVPRLIFLNKLDRAGANHNMCLNALKQRLSINTALTQIPIGLEDGHKGIVDLIQQKAFGFEGSWGINIVEQEVPKNLVNEMQERRHQLIEAIAEVDDKFAELYLEKGIESIQEQDIKDAIRRTTINRSFVPIFMGSAYKNKGVQLALNAVCDYLPDPTEVVNTAYIKDKPNEKVILEINDKKPFVGLAFKLEENRFGQLTYIRCYQGKLKRGDVIHNQRDRKQVRVSRMVRMHADEMEEIQEAFSGDIFALFGIECNSGDTFTMEKQSLISLEDMHVPEPVMSLSITPANKKSEGNFRKGLLKFIREDPTFKLGEDEESKETLISGMGELHLQIYAERLKREFGAEVILGEPTVNYREVIQKKVDFDYLHKKQTGGAGQYAGVTGYLEPISDVEGEYPPSQFVNKCVGLNLSPEYISSIEKAFYEVVHKGPQTGYPILNCRYVLLDGKTHSVDSSSLAFTTATKASFRYAFAKANPSILEPVMLLEVTCPLQFQNQVLTGIIKRRGHIIDTQNMTTQFIIQAEVPLAQMFGYSSEIRGQTQGQGEFSMEYVKHKEVQADELEMVRRRFAEKLKNK